MPRKWHHHHHQYHQPSYCKHNGYIILIVICKTFPSIKQWQPTTWQSPLSSPWRQVELLWWQIRKDNCYHYHSQWNGICMPNRWTHHRHPPSFRSTSILPQQRPWQQWQLQPWGALRTHTLLVDAPTSSSPRVSASEPGTKVTHTTHGSSWRSLATLSKVHFTITSTNAITTTIGGTMPQWQEQPMAMTPLLVNNTLSSSTVHGSSSSTTTMTVALPLAAWLGMLWGQNWLGTSQAWYTGNLHDYTSTGSSNSNCPNIAATTHSKEKDETPLEQLLWWDCIQYTCNGEWPVWYRPGLLCSMKLWWWCINVNVDDTYWWCTMEFQWQW